MTKRILAIAACVLTPALAHAEPAAKVETTADRATTGFGLRAGFSFSNFAFDDEGESEVGPESVSGLAVTGSAQFDLTRVFSLRPQLSLVQKGTSFDIDLLDVVADIDLLYADIDLLGVVRVPMQGGAELNLFVGPSLGILLSAEATLSAGDVTETEDIDEQFNDTDFAIVTGGGFSIPAGSGAVTAELRYQHGLRNLAAEDEPGEAPVTNRTYLLQLGYTF